MKIFPPQKIFISESNIHGLGVFSTTTIFEGEIIEECPVFDLNIKLENDFELLRGYVFFWPQPENYETIVTSWGYGNLYNHSNEPNAGWRADVEKKLFVIFALKIIKPYEEVLINYGKTYWN